MSFILDALKKSENDRQRQTGPALFEVKVAPPKAGFPVWAIAIVVLLVVNMVIVGWLLLRHQSKTEADTQPPQVASQAAPAQPQPGAAISQPAPTNTGPPAAQNYSPPPQQPNSQQPPQQAYSPPQQQAYSQPPAQESAPPMPRGSANTAGPQPDDLVAGRRISGRDQNEPTLASVNPDDDAPAQDPGSSLFKGHVRRGTESGLMLYQDLAVANGSNLPELRLDMHVYDPKPQARFALINMQKVTEGQMLKGEVKVEAITPEGVVLSHTGTRFLLPRE